MTVCTLIRRLIMELVPHRRSSPGENMGLRLVIPECPTCQPVLTQTVVLLDEAEVFLQERSLEDLQRNALVSGSKYSPCW